MGRRSIPRAALLFLVGFAVQAAEGKERKAPAAEHDRAALSDMIVSRAATAAHRDASAASTERSAAASSPVLDRGQASRNGAPMAPLRDQQPATSNALSLKLGAVTVRPAVGGIKGAQFSLGF
jgi:hypothetical protein